MAEHRVYMHFFVRGEDNATGHLWVLNFLEPDLRTSVGPIRSYDNEKAVRRIAESGRGLETEDLREAFVCELREGRGRVWLQLTDEQYQKLKRAQARPHATHAEAFLFGTLPLP